MFFRIVFNLVYLQSEVVWESRSLRSLHRKLLEILCKILGSVRLSVKAQNAVASDDVHRGILGENLVAMQHGAAIGDVLLDDALNERVEVGGSFHAVRIVHVHRHLRFR